MEEKYLLDKKEEIQVFLFYTTIFYWLGRRKLFFYGFSEHNDGDYVIYSGEVPFAYLSIVGKEFEPAITEILELVDEKDLNTYMFLSNIISLGTNYQLGMEPSPLSFFLHRVLIERTWKTLRVELSYLDINSIWRSLSEELLVRIISKTRQDARFNLWG